MVDLKVMPKYGSIMAESLVLRHTFDPAPDFMELNWDSEAQSGRKILPDGSTRPATAEEAAHWLAIWKKEKARYQAEKQAEAEAAEAAWNSEEARFERLRAERDKRLAATDYLAMPDYPLGDEQRTAVYAYRQALRDLPKQDGAPWDGGGDATPWPTL